MVRRRSISDQRLLTPARRPIGSVRPFAGPLQRPSGCAAYNGVMTSQSATTAPSLPDFVAPARILLAAPRGYCAGVERAVQIVERLAASRPAPIYVRKQIVHNLHVVRSLEAKGVVFVEELDEVPTGATVVFSAHGVAPEVRAQAAERGLDVLDATCPLVTKVHQEARKFARSGYDIVLIGHGGHEEVVGTMGHAAGMHLVADAAEAQALDLADPSRVAYLTQTTLSVDETSEAVSALRARFPQMEGPRSDDICYATQNRQHAVKQLAPLCDFLLVVGAENSSNSRRLVEVSIAEGCPARLIADVGAVDPEWFQGVSTLGVTSGASAPDWLVAELLDAFRARGTTEVEEFEVTREDVHFGLPAAVTKGAQEQG